MEIVKISRSAYVLRDSKTGDPKTCDPKTCDPKNMLNVGCVVTPDGVILVDPGCSAQFAAVLPERIREITDQPIAYVISTLARGDLASQAQFDAPVIAHASTGRGADSPSVATVTFTEDAYLYVGNVLIELLHSPGRAEGSLTVHLPDEKVLFAGDVVHTDTLPVTTGASAYRWRESLMRLRALTPLKVVPSRGRIGTPEDMDRHIAHLQSLIASADMFKSREETGLEPFTAEGETARLHKSVVGR